MPIFILLNKGSLLVGLVLLLATSSRAICFGSLDRQTFFSRHVLVISPEWQLSGTEKK